MVSHFHEILVMTLLDSMMTALLTGFGRAYAGHHLGIGDSNPNSTCKIKTIRRGQLGFQKVLRSTMVYFLIRKNTDRIFDSCLSVDVRISEWPILPGSGI
jgi:hypothetical protein